MPDEMGATELRTLFLAHVFPRALNDPMGAFLLRLAKALGDRGIEVNVIAPHAEDLPDHDKFLSTSVHRFRYAPQRWERLAYTGTMHEIVKRGLGPKILFGWFNVGFLFKAIGVIRSVRPHIIHSHWWIPSGWVGALASLLTRVPLIITTHGTDVELARRAGWALPFARFVFARTRLVTCGSGYLREQLVALGLVRAERVRVIPMPVNPLFEEAGHAAKTSATPLRVGVLTVARLTKQKSIDTLIQALAHLPEVSLKIIGDGPERTALQEQACGLKLQDRVLFLGELPQSELPRHYAACGVFVLPSIREGMGLVLAEAMFCGAPVIAANSGGIPDLVRDNETGLLVPERDPHALADAIEKILADRTLAARLALNGAAYVRTRFSADAVAAQFLEIYRACQ